MDSKTPGKLYPTRVVVINVYQQFRQVVWSQRDLIEIKYYKRSALSRVGK